MAMDGRGELLPRDICTIKAAVLDRANAAGEDSIEAEDSTSSVGYHFCAAKASALDRIRAAGGDTIHAVAEAKSRPFLVLNAADLKSMEAAGGCIIKSAVKEDGVGKVVTVQLPDAHVKHMMSRPPPKPLLALAEDYFEDRPDLREAMGAGAASVLSIIVWKEKVLALFFEKGYAVVEIEVVDSY